MRLVLDTNVYIAAFLNKGLASDVLRLGQRKKVELFVSETILKELRNKLKSKFNLEKKAVKGFEELILQVAELVSPKKTLKVIKNDPADNRIIECAVEAKADLIVSMDKHLVRLKKYRKIGIIHSKTLTWIIPRFF